METNTLQTMRELYAAHRDVVLAVINWACLIVLGPLACTFIAETLCLSQILELFDGYFLANFVVYLIIHLVLYLISRSIRFSCLFALVVVTVFSIANHFVIAFTGIPITFGDLMSAATGFAVAGGYTYSLDADIVVSLIIAVVYAAIVIVVPRSGIRVGFRQHRGAYAGVLVLALVSTGWLYASNLWDGIDTHEWNPAYPYTHCGFAMSLISDVTSASTLEAEGYYADTLWTSDNDTGLTTVNVGSGYTYDPSESVEYTEVSESSPNIIVIMNESFSDLTSYLDGYETNEDPMPYARSLLEDDSVISGTVAVSSDMGTGTANSEFEFLTGNSMSFFKGTTPYVQFINGETPSLASLLGGRGYSTLSMHAYEKAGYNRVRVYDYFGFDEYKGIEDFDVDIDYARDYPTDETDYRQLIEEFENNDSSSPQFIFNITMQNHGGYYATDYEWPLRVYQTEPETTYDDSVIAYESSIRMADDAVKELIEYFETVNEPTVILFYGDHEPRLSNEFYSSWFTDENALDLEWTATLHQTPFFMWSNFELDSTVFENGDSISLNYLSTLLMEACGMELSLYQQYLSDLREEHPVVTARYYTDSAGVKIGLSDDTKTDALLEYQWLQYNAVFDRANWIPGFYS